tara:strand:+ start:7841 stop:8083 length:243 start_codon:yes stop_codon:yes gene_type:complete
MAQELDVTRIALTVTEWVAIIALVLSVGSVVFTGGFMWGQVANNTTRIELVEPKVDEIALRLERIDANVGWLVERERTRP